MPENWDNVNLGNPANARHDEAQQNNAKVTNADHPVSENVRDVPIRKPGHTKFDSHSETIHDPDVEMPGERTSHVDPLSGDTGMHPVGVGVGAGIGGAAAGAVVGFAAGAVAGPLGAAIGAAVGTTLGAIGGGYTGKHIAEKFHPTSEDHHWRHVFASREYVPRGSKYEEWQPAYEFGIDMRETFMDKTWEEAEAEIRAHWEDSDDAAAMNWQHARLAIQDAWDHLTPDPGEPEVTAEELREE